MTFNRAGQKEIQESEESDIVIPIFKNTETLNKAMYLIKDDIIIEIKDFDWGFSIDKVFLNIPKSRYRPGPVAGQGPTNRFGKQEPDKSQLSREQHGLVRPITNKRTTHVFSSGPE